MKAKHLTLAAIALLFLGHAALADRQLDRAEILTIFGTLTGQPMTTWISTGTIRAAHEEYRAPETTSSAAINSQIQRAIQEYQSSDNRRALTEKLQKMELDAIPFNVRYRLSNEYTMTSMVVVEYDGSRFNWEINVQSRTDSVRPGPELAGNFMSDEFNLKWNRRRAFTWDGSKYTIYSRSANYAMVDATGSLPHVVNGPLTAGVVPWGYGAFSYANLSAAQSTADEKDANGQTQIHLTLRTSDGSDMLLVMDADRDCALISALTERADTTISTQYGNHRRVAGRWVPMTISIEQFDRWTNRMLAYDVWDFTSVSDRTPAIGSFSVAYEPDALIEYRSPVTDRPLTYRYSPMLDMDTLLTERLNFVASQGAQAQNCGTAALKYAASQLGKDATDRQLARLIDGANGCSADRWSEWRHKSSGDERYGAQSGPLCSSGQDRHGRSQESERLPGHSAYSRQGSLCRAWGHRQPSCVVCGSGERQVLLSRGYSLLRHGLDRRHRPVGLRPSDYGWL